jgi:hypothetical protein
MKSYEKNKNLSNYAYNINNNDENEAIKKDWIYNYDRNKKGLGKFKVLTVENNQNNGMQAMDVAPVDSNGEVEI